MSTTVAATQDVSFGGHTSARSPQACCLTSADRDSRHRRQNRLEIAALESFPLFLDVIRELVV
jgi:hypothetical protein